VYAERCIGGGGFLRSTYFFFLLAAAVSVKEFGCNKFPFGTRLCTAAQDSSQGWICAQFMFST
jgi:hypothetical protein